MNTGTASHHIPALDGLRGLAVIGVITCHVNHACGGPFVVGRVAGPLAGVFGAAWVGVDLFFVLSGFLITGILYDAKGADGYFRTFYVRRALRIMPLYFGFLLTTLVVLPALPWTAGRLPEIADSDALSLPLHYYNFRVALTERTLSYFHPFWSLAIEEHFYLFWPVAVWALRRQALVRACVVAAAASLLLRVILALSGAWVMTGFFITPCRLDGLLAGSLVALARRDPDDWRRWKDWAGRLALGSLGLLLGMAVIQGHFLPDVDFRKPFDTTVDSTGVVTIGLTGLAVFFAAVLTLVLDAAAGSSWRRLLENRTLCVVGKFSYAIYIFHSLILLLITAHFLPLTLAPTYVAKPATLVLVLGTSFVAAWLSYHLFEKHFLRLKRFFEFRPPAPWDAAGDPPPGAFLAAPRRPLAS